MRTLAELRRFGKDSKVVLLKELPHLREFRIELDEFDGNVVVLQSDTRLVDKFVEYVREEIEEFQEDSIIKKRGTVASWDKYPELVVLQLYTQDKRLLALVE